MSILLTITHARSVVAFHDNFKYTDFALSTEFS